MSDLVEVKAVRSNIDALSETRLHEALLRMVESVVSDSEKFLRADRAHHRRDGLLEEHIHSERVHEIAGVIEAKLGVTRVLEADERSTHGVHKRSDYPLFVEGGTRTPIFSPRGHAMWNMDEGIFGRMTVRGQEGQHFMAKTYSEARVLLDEDHSIADALREMNAEAAALRAGIEAT